MADNEEEFQTWMSDTDESDRPSISGPAYKLKLRRRLGVEDLLDGKSSVSRLPVHRDTVQAVAQQKDYMKRLRKNGGACDTLAREGIAILSGKYDGLLIHRLNLKRVGQDEFISFKPTSAADIAIMREAGKID